MKKLKNKKRKGFLLLEIVVSIGILGMILAISVPNYLEIMRKKAIDTDKISAKNIINIIRTGIREEVIDFLPGTELEVLIEEGKDLDKIITLKKNNQIINNRIFESMFYDINVPNSKVLEVDSEGNKEYKPRKGYKFIIHSDYSIKAYYDNNDLIEYVKN